MAYSTKAAQAFARILESEKDWEKRVIAMGKMEETLKTDFGLDMTTKDILLFRPALCAQLSDNRTSVTKAACELVTTLAETQSIGFAAHTQVIVSVLLKQTTVTVKVASDAAHVALCLMLRVQALPASKIYLEIMKGLKDGHNSTLRRRCSLYLLILIKFRFAGLKSMIDELPALLITLLRDSSATTRARARATYMHLTVSSPNHGKMVLQEVDAKVKATLTEEITLETADMDGFEPTPPASTANSRIGSRTTSRSTSRSASRSHSRSTSPERAKPSSSSSTASPSSGGLDLSSLERKLATLSARSPMSSPIPNSSPSSTTPSSAIPRTPSTVTGGSKSFVRGSPATTPTKTGQNTASTPSSTVKVSSVSKSKEDPKLRKAATTTLSPAPRVTTSTPTATTKRTATLTTVKKTPAPQSPLEEESEISNSFSSAESEGLKFMGDWRIALKELRALIRKTRTFLELEAPELENDAESSTQASNDDSLSTTTNQSSSSLSQAPLPSTSRIPLSPRSINQDAASVASDTIQEEIETDMEVVEDIEEGWSEVDDPNQLPAEDEESVVV